MNRSAWIVAIALALGLTGWRVAAAEEVTAEKSDAELIAQIDVKQPTDYSVLRAYVTPAKPLFFLGEPILVDFKIVNTSDKPVLVRVPYEASSTAAPAIAKNLVSGLPLDHVFSRKTGPDASKGRRALVIHASDDPITELDNDVVYKSPGPVEPIVIRPHGVVGRRVDLSKHYSVMRQPGRWLIQWRPYNDAVRSLTEEIKIMKQEKAVLETSQGNITLEMFYDRAPEHVENFLDLARRGFYDGTLFHRVIENFMIQAGDPLTTDPSKKPMWGTGRGPRTLRQEFNDTPFVPGVLGAARGPDVHSASCQFFIVTGQASHLNGQYTAFGRIAPGDKESLAVAMKISKVATDRRDCPVEPVKINKVRVEPVAPAATQPD